MKKIITTIMILCMALSSCTKDPNLDDLSDYGAVQFSTSSISSTRAVEEKDSWTATNDNVGIYMKNSTTGNLDYTNVQYYVSEVSESKATFSASDKIEQILYPHTGTATFYAYYPFNSENKSAVIAIDVAKQEDVLVSDQITDSEAEGVNFTFAHALSIVEITLEPSDMIDLSKLSVYINCITDASYDLSATDSNLSLETATNKLDFTLTKIDASSNYLAQAIVLPNDYSSTTIYFEAGDYKFEADLGKTFVSGTKYKYEAKIGYDLFDFSFEGDIEWNDGVTVSDLTAVRNRDGSESAPWEIYSRSDMDKIGAADSGWELSHYYIVMNNFDLGVIDEDEDKEWVPIGSVDAKFTGHFDGNGKTISGMKMTSNSEQSLGLFSYTEGSTITSLTIEGEITIPTSTSTVQYIGSFVGYNTGGIIKNCHSNVNIVNNKMNESFSGIIGGICGMNTTYGMIVNCYNSGTIAETASAIDPYYYNLGGIVGYNNNSVAVNCYNSAVIGDSYGDYVGGIAGYSVSTIANSNSLQNCYSSSQNISCMANGGIVGRYTLSSTIKDCYYNSDYHNVAVGKILGSDVTDGGIVPSDPIAGLPTSYMQYVSFASILNNNAAAMGSATLNGVSVPLCAWKYNADGYPTLDFDSTPTTTAKGDVNYPHEIRTEEQLRAIASGVEVGGITYSLSSSYLLMNDIALTGSDWTPIGDSDGAYYGTFDGNGYTISAMNIAATTTSTTNTYIGLFGYVQANGVIKNITVSGSVSSTISQTNTFVGGIVGYCAGTISGCTNLVNVTGTNSANNSIGGVVGLLANGSMTNSCNRATFTAPYNASGSGAIAGVMTSSSATSCSSIVNCYTSGAYTTNQTNGGTNAGIVVGVTGTSYTYTKLNTVGYIYATRYDGDSNDNYSFNSYRTATSVTGYSDAAALYDGFAGSGWSKNAEGVLVLTHSSIEDPLATVD